MIKELENDGVQWVDINKPNERAKKFLEHEFKVEPGILKEYLPPIKRPKVEDYKNCLFAVIHFPFFDPKTRKTQSTEMDIILFGKTLITSHQSELTAIERIFKRCQEDVLARKFYLESDAVRSLYRILDKLVDAQMPMLDHIDDRIECIEQKMFCDDEEKLLRELAIVKHDIIGFRKTIKPQRSVLESLALSTPHLSSVDHQREIKEVIGSNIKVWNTLENHKEMIEALEQTNESLFSHKLNDTMKLLTAASVIMLPLSVIAGIFGMNVTQDMPFMESASGFESIILIMLLSTIIIIMFFKYKRWL